MLTFFSNITIKTIWPPAIPLTKNFLFKNQINKKKYNWFQQARHHFYYLLSDAPLIILYEFADWVKNAAGQFAHREGGFLLTNLIYSNKADVAVWISQKCHKIVQKMFCDPFLVEIWWNFKFFFMNWNIWPELIMILKIDQKVNKYI